MGKSLVSDDVENILPLLHETAFDKLKRYTNEVQQIDIKIEHLKKKREEVLGLIRPLKEEVESVVRIVSDMEALSA